MTRIKQLSASEAQKIAAGEVVERPANVVKELVENALDAGATTISIYIKDAGKSLIRIVDNGCGMNTIDAHVCFKHHATSKISSVDDLPTLTTFGFRGEALSSICSVSKVTLITKEAHAPQGIKIDMEHAILKNESFVSCNTGTDIAVADLFFNVPARKKFLKTNETESRQIMLLFQAFCLDYLSVHFKLYSQDTLVYNCPPAADLQQRTAQLWDHTIAQQTIALNAQKDGIIISGVISNHTYARFDRSALFFFVNQRWIKNHALSKALLKGYMNVLQPDKFPLACISISLDPAQVDINIHPRKEEVQFLHPRIVENLLQTTVKQALENHLSSQLNKKVVFSAAPALNHSLQYAPTTTQRPLINPYDSVRIAPAVSTITLSTPQPTLAPQKTIFAPDSDTAPLPESFIPKEHCEYQILGQFSKTYILIEREDSLFLVDQHAAHERILYELFSKRFAEVATIGLLFPPLIQVTPEQMQLIEPHCAIFKENHIQLEIVGATQLMVQAIPAHLKEVDMQELIHQTIGWICEFQNLDADLWYKKVHEKLHAQMACKAAVKAGDSLTMDQMQRLIADLEKIENRFTCPHGRPTGWALALYEIEKKFKRRL